MAYESLEAFVRVLDENPGILSEEESSQLEELIPVWVEDDELDEQLGDWCAVNDRMSPKIIDALSSIEKERKLESDTDGVPKRAPGEGNSAPEIQPEDYEKMLLNAIHRNSSKSNTETDEL